MIFKSLYLRYWHLRYRSSMFPLVTHRFPCRWPVRWRSERSGTGAGKTWLPLVSETGTGKSLATWLQALPAQWRKITTYRTPNIQYWIKYTIAKFIYDQIVKIYLKRNLAYLLVKYLKYVLLGNKILDLWCYSEVKFVYIGNAQILIQLNRCKQYCSLIGQAI